jgi:DNA-binding MurR/RpiR family transcriptional regulator
VTTYIKTGIDETRRLQMKGHGSKYPQKREQAVAALLAHSTIGEAAGAVGVSEVTMWRWLQEEEFQTAYREAKKQIVQQAVTRIQQVTGEAVDTLREIMLDPKKPATSRVTAARTILNMAVKAVELDDLERRIEEIEKEVITVRR